MHPVKVKIAGASRTIANRRVRRSRGLMSSRSLLFCHGSAQVHAKRSGGFRLCRRPAVRLKDTSSVHWGWGRRESWTCAREPPSPCPLPCGGEVARYLSGRSAPVSDSKTIWSSSSTVKDSVSTKGTSCCTRKRVRRATATGCASRWKDRARSPISSMAKKAQSPTTRASMSSWNVTPPSNSSDPWARSKSSLSLAWRSASESGIGPEGSEALEAALGDHGTQRLLVGHEGACHVLVRVQGGQPAVLGGTVHAVVEKRTA